MIHQFDVRVGPVGFRIGSDWHEPVKTLEALYRHYPMEAGVPDFTVRLEATRPWRRWVRPSMVIAGDFTLPEAAPLPLSLGLLAAELGMNLQLALGERRFLLLHAASVERDGKCLILTGESGSGKSTLATLLGTRGWRFMGDEFALIAPDTGLAHPFPRPASLKNASIAAVLPYVDEARLGPVLENTPKGTIRHVVPDAHAIAGMVTPAQPAAVIFPRFGLSRDVRTVAPSEAFVRLTQASTNYIALGEAGFSALAGLVTQMPLLAIDYPDTEAGLALIEDIWGEL